MVFKLIVFFIFVYLFVFVVIIIKKIVAYLYIQV
jgi:hypothetical protein